MAVQQGAAPGLRTAAPRVLVVESDVQTATMARRCLARAGYRVEATASGRRAMAWVQRLWPDLVVLDAHLPGDDAMALGRLRACSDVPVVMISPLGDEYERAWALTVGADDFVPNPLLPDELVARVTSVLRRAQAAPRLVERDPGVVGREPMRLDVDTRRVWMFGRPGVALTALESRLLDFLASHPAQTLCRDELLERVWGYSIGNLSTVTVHVRRLREKIEPDPAHPVFILTVWGVGYRFDPSGGRDDRSHL